MFGTILPILIPMAAALGGLALGWMVGMRGGRAELRAYQAGVRDGRTSSCWVRGQVEGEQG